MILLDTHVLLWRNVGDRRLGASASRLIDEVLQAGEAAVSVVTFWEVAWLVARRRLGFDLNTRTWHAELLEAGLVELPLTSEAAMRAAELPGLSGDPVDRLIVSTALNGHRLMTADRRILDWPGQLDRIPASE